MTTGSTTWRDALVGEVQVRAIRPRNGPGCAAGDDRGCAALAELTRWRWRGMPAGWTGCDRVGAER
jgi:hypothetical protein